MLLRIVRPRASSAAAISFVPSFFVAPAIATRPSSGPPPRTTMRDMAADRRADSYSFPTHETTAGVAAASASSVDMPVCFFSGRKL